MRIRAIAEIAIGTYRFSVVSLAAWAEAMRNIDQLTLWREEVGRHLLKLDFRPHGDVPFSARISPVFMDGETRVTKVSMSPGTTFRDPALARDGSSTYALILARRKSLHICHAGKEIDLPAGGVTLLRNWEPGAIAGGRGLDFAAVVVPQCERVRRGVETGDALAACFDPRNAMLRLLYAYLRALTGGEPLQSPDARATVACHLADLVGLVVAGRKADSQDPYQKPIRQARIIEAIGYIEHHFQDAELTAGKVAAAIGVSSRYLEYLFKLSGGSYSARVRNLRLVLARNLLMDSCNTGRRIVDLALDAGFSDLSHFNRQYRERYGETPSTTRANASRSPPTPVR